MKTTDLPIEEETTALVAVVTAPKDLRERHNRLRVEHSAVEAEYSRFANEQWARGYPNDEQKDRLFVRLEEGQPRVYFMGFAKLGTPLCSIARFARYYRDSERKLVELQKTESLKHAYLRVTERDLGDKIEIILTA